MTTRDEYNLKKVAVTLYAFHIRSEFGKEVSDDAHLLWENLARLGNTFSIPELERIREHLICYENGQYIPDREDTGREVYRLPLLLKPGELEFDAVTLPGGMTVDGSIFPAKIHDAYSASLALVCGPVSVRQLDQLNPEGAFLPGRIRSSLGQTLILYAEPDETMRPHRAMADLCIREFLKDSDISVPEFRKAGRIFGGHVYEYENRGYDPLERCHIWVWLNQNPDAIRLLQKTYDDFTDLLLCRSKILSAYHEACYCFKKARKFYEKLDRRYRGLKDLLNENPEERLEKLEPLLAEVPSDALDYGLYLRDMADHRTTLRVNAENYLRSLESISSLTLRGDDTVFLKNFHELAERQFDYQIRTDLNYLSGGQRLSQQVIDVIRGMIEADILRQLKDTLNSFRTPGGA